jgi:hypothetical protein
MKRVYFETTETITKNRKGWLEIDTDFTQVYDCFSKIAVKLKSITSVKLLFWLLSHEASKSNGINSGKAVYQRFSQYLKEEGAESVTERTFQACFEELRQVKALSRLSKGCYYLNPYIFWRDDKNKRIEYITEGAKEDQFIAQNAVEP